VAYALCDLGLDLKGADLVIASDVPIGAGMSSSAALEVSVGFALWQISELHISRFDLARAAQKAEHLFVGTNSGLMDQLTAVFAETNHAMLIDCRSFELKQIPMELPDVAVVVCDTRVKHALVNSAYNQRRAECENAVALLAQAKPGITALRDVTLDELDLIAALPEPERSRARHVATENDRTLRAARALAGRQIEELGRLLIQSHQSLREDFAVSCRELDIMVELALKQPGVYGARMMGGGFGGCTINLVQRATLEHFEAIMTRDYQQATGLETLIHVVQADEGVREFTC
ncbi:MAG TPA: galactokinase, partial [Pyrinomonadaceae bacterium]|nr:galactokinase [Pyrinomonadaceae bacterium]